MYRRPKFLEILLDIRCEMAHEADYDVELFAEMVRTGRTVDGAPLSRQAKSQAERTDEHTQARPRKRANR
jgi:hypothetical protein